MLLVITKLQTSMLPECALSYLGEGRKIIDQCEVPDDRVSVARLSVGVDQLSNNDVCTVKELKCSDEINYVDGETSVSQYVYSVYSAVC